jgi:prepilin-type N-terminal cleavage/methylation domain-containing protein
MRRCAKRHSAKDERGFTLLELVVALTLISTVALGFSLTVGSGFRTIAVARQRQTASDILSARIEHLRNIPYEEVALSSQPVHASDSTDPDFFVANDGTTYDVDGDGTLEALIVDVDHGSVLHFEDPVQVSSTVMRIYQYVTWVDDPAVAGTQNYRRVTVVAQFKAPAANGVNQMVRMSSLFTPAGVTVGPSTASTTTTSPSASTTTTPSATTSTTTETASCPGDASAPTGGFTIASSTVSDVGYTAAASVGLKLNLADVCAPITAAFSNDGETFGSPVSYDATNTTLSWSLEAGDGVKTVTAQASDGAGNEQSLGSQTIILDTTKPAVPGTLNRTLSCSGSNRTATLSWGASSDTHLHGYRVYKSTDGTTWQAIDTASAYSYSDTHKKNLDSVRYYVVAYDRAGNESNATNTLSLSNNQC